MARKVLVTVVGLDEPPLGALPGLSAAVSIATATHPNVLTVPIQAVASREPQVKETLPDGGPASEATIAANGKPKPIKVVFVVSKDGKATMRPVHTGIASRTDVEILDGVAEGDTIVNGPYRTLARDLKDGQSVKVLSNGAAGPNPAENPGGRS